MVQLSGDKLAYIYEPSANLTEYTDLADQALSLAIATGLTPGKLISLSVLHKGRGDYPTGSYPKYHELIVAARPPPYHAKGLMWMGSLVGDEHYRIFHVCTTDPPEDAQWAVLTDSSYVYDPMAYVTYLKSVGPSSTGSPTTQLVITDQPLSEGDFVNVFNSTGPRVRQASASDPSTEASGFVLASYAAGVPATVYLNGINSKVTGQVPGPVFLSTIPGQVIADPSSLTSGQIVQRVGTSLGATTVNFQPDIAIILA